MTATVLQPAFAFLDVSIRHEVLKMRARYDLSQDEFHGLYVSDAQVDALLERQEGTDRFGLIRTELARSYPAALDALAAHPRWRRLAGRFELSDIEALAIFLALAPQADPKYAPLFAYLNNDVRSRWLTAPLLLRLTGRGPEDPDRLCLTPRGKLARRGLMQAVTQEGEATAQGWRPADLVADYLVGAPPEALLTHDALRLIPAGDMAHSDLPVPEGLRPVLEAARQAAATGPVALISEVGNGRCLMARKMLCPPGARVCEVRLRQLLDGPSGDAALREAILGMQLLGATALVTDLPDKGGAACQKAIAALGGPDTRVILIAETVAAARRMIPLCHEVHLPAPTVEGRQAIWHYALAQRGLRANKIAVGRVADLFALSFRAIGEAAELLASDPACAGGVPDAALIAAARARSARTEALTERVENDYTLDDLVLPPVVRDRIGDFVAATRHRRIVYDTWGMSRRLGPARGLSALFTGSSGTGKSMAASAIAKALELDIYRIELSAIVSKYIGETEKNLDAAFEAARAANCILFFDEADALFGKRSEVKDAHDRYANIECAYLLQKMERHDGIVILTTNLPRSLDTAFSRRIQYVIDFPRPDAALRESLWRGIFPPGVPMSEDVDHTYLARNFDCTGGEIRNIALDAALQAAAVPDGRISMQGLMKAVERQMIKQGRATTGHASRQYAKPIRQAAE